MEIDPNIVALMKPGDIIQYHHPDKLIPWNMFYWSHTIMYIGNDTIIHASGKVRTSNIYDFFRCISDMDNFTVLRVKNVLQDIINKVVDFVKEQIGKPFDMWSLYRFTKQKDPPSDHPGFGYYCTELIWAAYIVRAGIDLDMNNVGWINPMEIYMNRKVKLIYTLDKSDVPFPWKRLW